MIQYRHFYAKRYGITIPKGYDIHHIDGDRENNSIGNLLLLPDWMHRELHKRWDAIEPIFGDFTKAKKILSKDYNGCVCASDAFQDIADILDAISPWVAKKWYEEEAFHGRTPAGGLTEYSYDEFRK